jgi:hypothetical protein
MGKACCNSTETLRRRQLLGTKAPGSRTKLLCLGKLPIVLDQQIQMVRRPCSATKRRMQIEGGRSRAAAKLWWNGFSDPDSESQHFVSLFDHRQGGKFVVVDQKFLVSLRRPSRGRKSRDFGWILPIALTQRASEDQKFILLRQSCGSISCGAECTGKLRPR